MGAGGGRRLPPSRLQRLFSFAAAAAAGGPRQPPLPARAAVYSGCRGCCRHSRRRCHRCCCRRYPCRCCCRYRCCYPCRCHCHCGCSPFVAVRPYPCRRARLPVGTRPRRLGLWAKREGDGGGSWPTRGEGEWCPCMSMRGGREGEGSPCHPAKASARRPSGSSRRRCSPRGLLKQAPWASCHGMFFSFVLFSAHPLEHRLPLCPTFTWGGTLADAGDGMQLQSRCPVAPPASNVDLT